MSTHPFDFRLDRPGALIAALPAILGFVPAKSLVLVSLESGHLGAVMRADLSSDLIDHLERLAEVVSTSGADRVVAVIVDADGALCPMCNDEHRRLCDALGSELGSRQVTLYAAHVVDRVEAGGTWHCVDGCGSRGSVEDPSASPLAAAAVLDGRRLYARREDLQAVIEVGDHDRAAALTELIAAEARRRESEWGSDPDGCGRRDVQRVMALASRVGDGAELDEPDIPAMACALTDVAVRDTLYALAVGTAAENAERLWALLSRVLPSPWRTEALVLLAFSAYVRGDGPLAGVSLDAALKIDGGHRMAGMLSMALQSGMRPEQIRELAGTGYRIAKRLGVRLPPRRAFSRRAV